MIPAAQMEALERAAKDGEAFMKEFNREWYDSRGFEMEGIDEPVARLAALCNPSTILSLIEDNKRMREALKPFATAAEWLFQKYRLPEGRFIEAHASKPDDAPFYGIGDYVITYGDMRRARAALGEKATP